MIFHNPVSYNTQFTVIYSIYDGSEYTANVYYMINLSKVKKDHEHNSCSIGNNRKTFTLHNDNRGCIFKKK